MLRLDLGVWFFSRSHHDAEEKTGVLLTGPGSYTGHQEPHCRVSGAERAGLESRFYWDGEPGFWAFLGLYG